MSSEAGLLITERAFLPGREDVTLRLVLADPVANNLSAIVESQLTVVGGAEALALASEWRGRLNGTLSALPLPAGNSPFEILLREILLKMKGEWKFPYEEAEVCHCRVVSLETVDAAIICGAHTPQKVSEWTSASTACGTCRPDVTAILAYRLTR